MFGKVRWIVVMIVVGVVLSLPAAAQVQMEMDLGFDRADGRGHDHHGRVVAHANGEYDWIIDASDVFGFQVDNVILFDADKRADGTISGRIFYRQKFLDNDFLILISVTCLEVYDHGTRVKIGGIVESASDPRFEGLFGWFQATEAGRWTPAVSTVVGFGDETANEEFCASPALPNFGPWDVDGKLNVKARGGDDGDENGDDDDDDDGD